ncbi:MAG: hypothetical protein P4N59_10825 [Negativicutes bacterium]|nr:hypothetical protein [Negativicutes bacterium]
MANTAELAEVFKTIILELFPELGGYHFPIRAKVVKVHEDGGQVDDYNKLYSVDVQPLKPDGSVDESKPVIPDIEIPVLWGGPDRGVFCLPVVGGVVRVGFYYNDPAYPFIDAVLADGFSIPDHALGSLIIQMSTGVRIEIDKTGQIFLLTPQKVMLGDADHPVTLADTLKAAYDAHIHPTPSGPSGPPTAALTGHDSKQVFTG